MLIVSLWHRNTCLFVHAMASRTTGVSIVCSAVFSGADQRKKLSVAGLCDGESTGDRWILLTMGQLRGKCFHLMTSSRETVFQNIFEYQILEHQIYHDLMVLRPNGYTCHCLPYGAHHAWHLDPRADGCSDNYLRKQLCVDAKSMIMRLIALPI